jgi:hypothetical protein
VIGISNPETGRLAKATEGGGGNALAIDAIRAVAFGSSAEKGQESSPSDSHFATNQRPSDLGTKENRSPRTSQISAITRQDIHTSIVAVEARTDPRISRIPMESSLLLLCSQGKHMNSIGQGWRNPDDSRDSIFSKSSPCRDMGKKEGKAGLKDRPVLRSSRRRRFMFPARMYSPLCSLHSIYPKVKHPVCKKRSVLFFSRQTNNSDVSLEWSS